MLRNTGCWRLGRSIRMAFARSTFISFFRFHFLSYDSPISRFCPSGDVKVFARPLLLLRLVSRHYGQRYPFPRVISGARAARSYLEIEHLPALFPTHFHTRSCEEDKSTSNSRIAHYGRNICGYSSRWSHGLKSLKEQVALGSL